MRRGPVLGPTMMSDAGVLRARGSSGFLLLLHAGILTVAFLALTSRMAIPVAWVLGGVSVAIGVGAAEGLNRRNYRLFVPFGLGVLSLLLFAGALLALTRVLALATLLGPVNALEAAEAIRFSMLGFVSALALRSLSLRFRVALALEGAVVTWAVASSVAAHRDGMIARPLDIADWFWARGVDPVVAFLAVGVFGAVLLGGVLTERRRPLRTFLQMGLVFIVAALLASWFHGRDVRGGAEGSALSVEEDKDGEKSPAGKGAGQNSQEDLLPPSGEGPRARPAAVVVFHRDVHPIAEVFYFRHAAFSQYNGLRLVESNQAGLDEDVRRDFPIEKVSLPGAEVEADHRTLVATDVALLTPHARLFALISPTEIEPMPNPEPARFVRAYHVVSNVLAGGGLDELLGLKAGNAAWPESTWAYYTAAPKETRYRALAEAILQDVREEYRSDPLAIALSVKRYLEETTTYSLQVKYEGDDPVGSFLFGANRKGYCVHLATSLALLVRSLGVPARVSAGYAVPAENLKGGSALLIKTGDAHAWAEIYLEGVGWTPIEVTPKKSDVKPVPFQEADLQQLLGEMARREGRTSPQAYHSLRLGALMGRLARGVLWLILVLVVLGYLVKTWRLFVPRWARSRDASRLAYRAAVDRLGAMGLTRMSGESRERFARRMGVVAPSFIQLSQIHLMVVFGDERSRSASTPSPTTSAKLSWQVGRELSSHTPRWRRFFGAVNPVSWLWSR